MARATTIDRDAWLGYRWARHGLGGDAVNGDLDDLLVLGVQGNRQSRGEHALSQRVEHVRDTAVADAITPEGPLVCLWSVRGAPHAHRAEQLDLVRDALEPSASDDGGPEFVRAVDDVAEALAGIVTPGMSKGEASRRVSDSVAPSLVTWCARCRARHVDDEVFRAAGRRAQIVLGSEGRTTTLSPKPIVTQESVESPRERLLATFFRVNGPLTRTIYREWNHAGVHSVGRSWEDLGDELVRVQVGSARYDLPGSLLPLMDAAPSARGVALVPSNDPYLRRTDRALLVPEAGRRKKVFTALSGPGALLVDGEIAGIWRYRRSAAEVTIELFDPVHAAQKTAAEARAAAMASSTGDDSPTVIWS